MFQTFLSIYYVACFARSSKFYLYFLLFCLFLTVYDVEKMNITCSFHDCQGDPELDYYPLNLKGCRIYRVYLSSFFFSDTLPLAVQVNSLPNVLSLLLHFCAC